MAQLNTSLESGALGKLVLANRILFAQGVVDAFGHVSVRHPERPTRFLLARNMAPAQVMRDDILEFDLEGTVQNSDKRGVYLERFIHGEIYRVRPDVMSVIHSHSPAVVPFGVSEGVPFRAVCHMSGFIGTSTPLFEIRETAGEDSDLLIRTGALGAALARSLGSSPLVLMRGHGSTVVGASLEQAVFRAIYTEVNARLQAEALRLGGRVNYLTPGETRTTAVSIDTQVKRAWDLWCLQAEGKL